MKKIVALILLFSQLMLISTPFEHLEAKEIEKVDFILDWVPNTNHTGIFVAIEKGYLEDVGIELDVKRPPEGSATDLVGLGQAPFGIGFQDSMAAKLEKGLPITTVAAIIEHNTSGLISKKEANIQSPKDLVKKRYGTWHDQIELAMVEYLVNEDGGDFSSVELVPNQGDNSITGLATNQFDAAFIYYAWDGILAKHQGIETNYFDFREYSDNLDFYSPVIVANNDYLKEHPNQARDIIQAIKKGYQYAIANPIESSEILLKYAPDLKGQEAFVKESQEWISQHYATEPSHWGKIDESRWNRYYEWLQSYKLIEKDLTKTPFFTNEFVEE